MGSRISRQWGPILSHIFQAGGARFMLALAAAAAGSAVHAQDVPSVISPLRVEPDPNGINLIDGKTTMDTPVLSVPGAPNLRFDRIQNAAPYVSGRIQQTGPGEYPRRSYSVHTGTGTSEGFQCIDFDCSSVTGTGSTFRWNSNVYRQAGSAAVYTYNLQHVSTTTAVLYYASQVTYPNGEVISYSYQTATLNGDPFPRTFYRPVTVTSNLGYFISITYQGNDFNGNTTAWATPYQVTLYSSAAPTTQLGRLTYSGNTITDLGDGTNPPRVYTCTGCNNTLGADIEVAAGSNQLPGEASPAVQVAAHPSAPVVTSVTRDGIQWTYAYDNLRYQSTNLNWLYDRVTVNGPNGYHNVYDIGQAGAPTQLRNVLYRTTDSISRATNYLFDEAYRPYRVVYPEGNQVDVSYDEYGNVTWRRTRAKPGTGLPDIIETASYPSDTCFNAGTPILCYRPTWSRDGLNRQTDYAYNANGQLIEQTDPADANGVRRKTYITYETGTLSRRSVVRVCGLGTTCGTSQEIRTEYQYWGSTFLPALERRIDGTTGQQLDTTYSYDAAGRLLSTDGPLAGAEDATYNRYDGYGRKTWEIGPLGANGLRMARRYSYRDSDDRPLSTETGTIPDAYSTNFTPISRTDFVYDSRRNSIRETASASGTTYEVVQRAFDDQGRLDCTAIRMNPAAFGSLPASACLLGPEGTGANAFGPDRITHNIYDAAGQLLQEQRAYGTSLQQNYATYSYSPNGNRTSLTDANGNRAELTWDGYDRQRRWIFPSPTTPGVANQADYEEYGYDLVGNRTSLRKRDGSTLTYQYDALNRMIVKVVPERAGLDPSNTRDVYYAYNVQNLQTEARFDSLSGDGVSNAYDGFGRTTSSTTRSGALVRTLSYQYDTGSRRTRITHPDTQPFTYAYSPAGELTGVYQGIGTSVALGLFTYNPQGRPGSRTEGAGSAAAYTYDSIGRLTSLTDSFVGGSGNVALTFGYNPSSQISQRTRNNDAYASNTAYNVSRSYAVNGLNQYTTAGSAGFTYDANGNLISDGTRTFTYDVENRLVAASGGVQLGYDPLGRLAWTTGSPDFRRFLYDGDALVAEYDYGGSLVHRYVHGSDTDADDPLVWYDGPAVRWLHADNQGSIVAATNGSGALASINAYDQWGIPNATNVGRFQYTGQAWLPELGMYHYKARIYSPTLGRFLQTDPVGYEDQMNLYAYVGNDPVNFLDSSGKCRQGAVATGAYGRGTTTVIVCSDGYNEVRSGGSLAWRNNNPGNIEAGPFARGQGAVGRAGMTPAGRFAVFPDVGTGRRALSSLLLGPRYRSLTPLQAIARYAPPVDNNTANYQRIVQRALGDTGRRTIGELTDNEMSTLLTTIGRVEGWGVGRVTYERAANGSATIRASYTVTGSRIVRTAQCTVDEKDGSCK